MRKVHKNIGDAITRAWQDKDYSALEQVLASKLMWYEDMLEEPITTARAVMERWQHDVAQQSNINVIVTLLDAIDDCGYYECGASWQLPSGAIRTGSAIFVTALNDGGLIISFKQWWTSKDKL